MTVRDLEIDGDKAHQTGRFIRGLRWRASTAASGGVLCEHGTFERLYIHDVTESGLVIAGGRWAKISGVHTERCGSTGNIGAGIHISNDFPDTSLLSCDVQISDCSDDGSGLDGGSEGAGLQLQVNTHDIQVSNYTSWNATKYGVKCQAHQVELSNIQVFEPGGMAGIALQYNDVRATNLRIEKNSAGSSHAIDIAAPQQGTDPRDISMDLSNIHIVGQGFRRAIAISNDGSETDPVRHIHITNVNIQSIGADTIERGINIYGNVRDCSIAHAHVRDCVVNIDVGGSVIGKTTYVPQDIEFWGVHSQEMLGAGGAGTYGWRLLYGSGMLYGCTSTRLAGSSRVLWEGHLTDWGISNAKGVAWCNTFAETTPTRTISSGALAAGRAGYIEVHPESGSSDDLTDITGGVVGQMLTLKADGGDTITVKHNASKIILPGGVDYVLSGDKRLLLYCLAAGKWTVLNA